jgi:hypothetical protein
MAKIKMCWRRVHFSFSTNSRGAGRPENPFPLRQNFFRQSSCARRGPVPPAAPIHAGAAGNFRATGAGRGCVPRAPPIFLLVTTPSLGGSRRAAVPVGDETAEHKALAGWRTRAKSRFCARRDERLSAGVSAIRGMTRAQRMALYRRQAFAAHATAVGQRGLAALGGVAVEKPVLAFAADFRRLILAFHKFKSMVSGKKPERGRIAPCEARKRVARLETRQ